MRLSDMQGGQNEFWSQSASELIEAAYEIGLRSAYRSRPPRALDDVLEVASIEGCRPEALAAYYGLGPKEFLGARAALVAKHVAEGKLSEQQLRKLADRHGWLLRRSITNGYLRAIGEEA